MTLRLRPKCAIRVGTPRHHCGVPVERGREGSRGPEQDPGQGGTRQSQGLLGRGSSRCEPGGRGQISVSSAQSQTPQTWLRQQVDLPQLWGSKVKIKVPGW